MVSDFAAKRAVGAALDTRCWMRLIFPAVHVCVFLGRNALSGGVKLRMSKF